MIRVHKIRLYPNDKQATLFAKSCGVARLHGLRAVRNLGFQDLSKGIHDSFRADNGPSKQLPNAVKVDDKRVRLPLIGWVRMAETIRFDGNIKSATVSKKADQWHVALAIETTKKLSGKISALLVSILG